MQLHPISHLSLVDFNLLPSWRLCMQTPLGQCALLANALLKKQCSWVSSLFNVFICNPKYSFEDSAGQHSSVSCFFRFGRPKSMFRVSDLKFEVKNYSKLTAPKKSMFFSLYYPLRPPLSVLIDPPLPTIRIFNGLVSKSAETWLVSPPWPT